MVQFFFNFSGPPGTWKSQNAFRYAQRFLSKNIDRKSLIWKIDCNTEHNIYISLSHLMNYLKQQCVNSENHFETCIQMMLTRATSVLSGDNYKYTNHLFILLGFISPKCQLMDMIIRHFKSYENISVIVTSNQSLSSEFDHFVIDVKGMTEKEAVDFLNVKEAHLDAAKELAKKLSYLPDGLIFARTYLSTPCNRQEAFREHKKVLRDIWQVLKKLSRLNPTLQQKLARC